MLGCLLAMIITETISGFVKTQMYLALSTFHKAKTIWAIFTTLPLAFICRKVINAIKSYIVDWTNIGMHFPFSSSRWLSRFAQGCGNMSLKFSEGQDFFHSQLFTVPFVDEPCVNQGNGQSMIEDVQIPPFRLELILVQ